MGPKRVFTVPGAATFALALATAGMLAACGSPTTGPTKPATAGTSTGHASSAAPDTKSPSMTTPSQSVSVTSGMVCHIFTASEEQAILGQPVQGSKASSAGAGGDGCTCGAGTVPPGSQMMFQVTASAELLCSSPKEAAAWSAVEAGSPPIPGDPYGVRSAGGSGGLDSVRLRNGCVFSASAAVSTAGVRPGSIKALQSAMDAVYARTS